MYQSMCVCVWMWVCICHHTRISQKTFQSSIYYFNLLYQSYDIHSTQTIYNLDYSTVLQYPFFPCPSQTQLLLLIPKVQLSFWWSFFYWFILIYFNIFQSIFFAKKKARWLGVISYVLLFPPRGSGFIVWVRMVCVTCLTHPQGS